ncbi:Nitrilase family, member 2 [Seminavis robusta]|uniref:Nitrilase family, member 2 n=1 Tax=Seminavis robusta TaxID=568900 RepID=A0A9N8H5W5_9STRA|nr:Nitrilase family, member 2 [Seminavis robusta]|eukprot:Sro97_g050060.1 Nitrilase family, member 2 (335) ;mRNA; f:81459-82463
MAKKNSASAVPVPVPAMVSAQKKKRETKPRANSLKELPPCFIPSNDCVMCAKGKQAKGHPGNQFLVFLIKAKLEEYRACNSKVDRSGIVSQILKKVADRGGLFVRQLTQDGQWFDVGPRNAREKVGQMFRDSLSDIFSSSTKAKAVVRRTKCFSKDADTDAKEKQDTTSASSSTRTSKTSHEAPPGAMDDSNLQDFPFPVTMPPEQEHSSYSISSKYVHDVGFEMEDFSSWMPVDLHLSMFNVDPLPLTNSTIDADFHDIISSSTSSSASDSTGTGSGSASAREELDTSTQSLEHVLDEVSKGDFDSTHTSGFSLKSAFLKDKQYRYSLNLETD